MLENVLRLGIPSQVSRQISSKTELENLMKSYSIIEQALNDFNKGLLTWEEYLDLLELHEVNIDSYLNTVDYNLRVIGIG